jgi:hypothetical protein
VKIGIVLDATAVLAYARIEGIAVGELISVVRDDDDICAIPALVLLDVWADLKPPEQALVADLIGREDPPVMVIPFTEDQVAQVAAIASEDGQSMAHAVTVAIANDTTVMTYTPDRFRRWLDEDQVLGLSEGGWS